MNMTWALIAGLLCMASTALAEMSSFYDSAEGHFRLRFESDLEPLSINKIHTWRVLIENRNGEPAGDATVLIDGGMPAHDHGLPTAPRMTRELDDGLFLIEGMRFHMGGYWEIAITITHDGVSDTVLIPLEL